MKFSNLCPVTLKPFSQNKPLILLQMPQRISNFEETNTFSVFVIPTIGYQTLVR